MGLTLDRLKELVEGEDLRYFLAPDRPMVMMAFRGIHGSYQVVVPLEVDGRFLQVRTVGYMHCLPDHEHAAAVLAVLGQLNHRLRAVKFGWDPQSGEIVAYADVWVEDGDLTQRQFGALLRSVIPAIDVNHQRLTKTMASGQDPGEASADSLLAGSIPPELRALVDAIASRRSDDDGGGDHGDDGADQGDDDRSSNPPGDFSTV